MKDINFPPFYPGQRIVCVDDAYNFIPIPIKKDIEYRVISCKQSGCSCKQWIVDIGITSECPNTLCNICGGSYISSPEWFLRANRFVPIEEKFESISLTKVYEIESPLISVN